MKSTENKRLNQLLSEFPVGWAAGRWLLFLPQLHNEDKRGGSAHFTLHTVARLITVNHVGWRAERLLIGLSLWCITSSEEPLRLLGNLRYQTGAGLREIHKSDDSKDEGEESEGEFGLTDLNLNKVLRVWTVIILCFLLIWIIYCQ